MSGKKGAKWSADKLRPTKKCNVALDMLDYEKVSAICKKCGQSVNYVLKKLISQALDNNAKTDNN